MTGILNNDNDAVNGDSFLPPESPTMTTTTVPFARRARPLPPRNPVLDGAGRAKRAALFSRRNFTSLIDRGKRTREIIDFLLRRALTLLPPLSHFNRPVSFWGSIIRAKRNLIKYIEPRNNF
ncbi:hypothetical protein PUN28_018149 [Cardiocondyla obscurior]|uniref:Uncharacterized protein n=1 Tax=Cardiocondyla obscurior TaxID=286306 RepID=A0AAW2ELG5_9HYME